MGQSWHSLSRADGWDQSVGGRASNIDHKTYSNESEYAAANNVIETEAKTDGRPFEAMFSGSRGYTRLDQSDPSNAILRQLAESRVIYFENGDPYHVSGESYLDIDYGLQIENLSGIPLNIVFGNHIRGVLFQWEEGYATIQEDTLIEGFEEFHALATVNDVGVAEGGGGWENALFSQTYLDPYLGSLPGFRLNSFQFYGSRSFAPGETDTIRVHHRFQVVTGVRAQNLQVGVGVADFSGTADLTIRAYDDQGNDLTSQIRLGYTAAAVPEPMTVAALGLGLVALARRRRQR
ncbi:MAG TPA: PEP-CTERM sorting domain-containing protein [Fimbriimonadaceae bacterium]|nr:PEP-CTERM sorting domain-containing protein [Fimbriimonadaceae bacterium]